MEIFKCGCDLGSTRYDFGNKMVSKSLDIANLESIRIGNGLFDNAVCEIFITVENALIGNCEVVFIEFSARFADGLIHAAL